VRYVRNHGSPEELDLGAAGGGWRKPQQAALHKVKYFRELNRSMICESFYWESLDDVRLAAAEDEKLQLSVCSILQQRCSLDFPLNESEIRASVWRLTRRRHGLLSWFALIAWRENLR
jgi:hypothetical protein